MLSPKASNYLDAILSYVNYTPARKEIRLELSRHLEDKAEFYMSDGNTEEEAENMTIRDMGNYWKVGRALNKQHKPLLGWLMKNVKAFMITAVLLIFCAVSFQVGVQHARNEEAEWNTNTYISSLYWEIRSTTHLLSSVENWNDSVGSTDHTINPFSQLLFRLNTMKDFSQSAGSYIRYTEGFNNISNITNSFELIYQSIAGGVSYNNRLLCYDFLKDHVLSEPEIKFLQALREDLHVIEAGLYNKETKQYQFDMSLEAFTELINPFVNKYSVRNLSSMGLSN